MTSQPTAHSEQTKSKGKHASTACLGCRRRKIKCDNVNPKCSNCVLYGQECVFQYGVDKRKIAPKDRLQSLTAYCQELESLLTTNGFPLPPAPPLHVQKGATSQRPAYVLPGVNGQPASDSTGQRSGDDWLDQKSYGDHFLTMPTKDSCWNDGYCYPGSSPDQPVTEADNSNASSDLLVDQLSGRMGSLQIAEDGQLRFYGATSNLHILHNGPLSLSRANFRSPDDGADLLRGAGVGHPVEHDLEEHLLKLYFCWEDPSIHVVDESIFWRERRKCLSTNHVSSFYSEVLANAMCAIGATMTTRRYAHLPEPLPDFFATRSKLLLDLEMDAPTLSTVQSLVVLSAVEAALTRDARGWLDSGMAVRLAVDLGLHLDPAPYVQAGIISAEEEMIRKVVWAGVFIHDRMWSMYVGRPVGLDDKHITVQLSLSEVSRANVPRYWSPYIDDNKSTDSPIVLDSIDDLCVWNVKLCAHMTAIRETLYPDDISDPKSLRQLCGFASQMSHRLADWRDSLPRSLAVDYGDTSTYYLPHVLQLHMQYHCVVIITNRPFFASAKTMPDLTQSDISSRRNTCTDSANDFAKLVDIYRRLYGLRRINVQAVHLLFTATLIHVFTACGALDQRKSDHAWNNLEICCQALSEMSLSFKNASRALEVVMSIKSDLLRNSRAKLKRPNPWSDGQDFDAGSQRKRRPTEPESELFRPVGNFQPSSLDATFLESAEPLNFFDTSYDDFSLDTLFWTGFNSLELPHLPPQDPNNVP
ncbi:hypothetical protein LTR47_005411 [Exophiala xenobiotica]|nr:hypothetical protein LTR72_010816 [Exophiala xenobiotica]KAK5233318.1 hypothetical protein LTR47_005411 [Exophiala xenobiotica]KAK5246583.1 hypothetical protein LTS06_008159 [Exophiala xenobiotica]KAK5261660.1 hypothetical protein LTR40_001823 [Exophiala xenobiotica]KAK5285680.1 hypothetical protein LTR14_010795 [Exophiala xenobiotica]